MPQKPDEEVLLWLQFKGGDREAFATLYQKHSIPLIAYGMKLCPDLDLLKDQIQELFVELWHSREGLSPTDNTRFYLLKALRYKLIRQEKNRVARVTMARLSADLSLRFCEEPVETALIEREVHESQMALLRQALKELPLRQQEIIQLRFYQGLTNEQIADLMNMNYQSASNLLYRAICRLKDLVQIPAFKIILLLFFFV
ncbi:MAG TPA: sigma-70 family RNA polymerase sigma factor [Puia sp.]|nr:sigma-70 family RNA polymerase sigma factor [Puia sp.]